LEGTNEYSSSKNNASNTLRQRKSGKRERKENDEKRKGTCGGKKKKNQGVLRGGKSNWSLQGGKGVFINRRKDRVNLMSESG